MTISFIWLLSSSCMKETLSWHAKTTLDELDSGKWCMEGGDRVGFLLRRNHGELMRSTVLHCIAHLIQLVHLPDSNEPR